MIPQEQNMCGPWVGCGCVGCGCVGCGCVGCGCVWAVGVCGLQEGKVSVFLLSRYFQTKLEYILSPVVESHTQAK